MIQQNTAEWLKLRKNYVGASDAPAIMQVSPWSTPYQLWQEKLDLIPAKEENRAMAEGKRREAEGLKVLEEHTGLIFGKDIKFHPSIKFMMASLDAVDLEGNVIGEIKLGNEEDQAEVAKGNVPQKYFPQLQHQMEVCEKDFAYYVSLHVKGNLILKVYRDDNYIKEMIKKEEEFWECVQTLTEPKKSAKDYVYPTSGEWKSLEDAWCSLMNRKKPLEESLETLKKEEKMLMEAMIREGHGSNIQGEKVRLTQVIRAGTVDYKAIPQLQGVNLDEYRKEPIKYWRATEL